MRIIANSTIFCKIVLSKYSKALSCDNLFLKLHENNNNYFKFEYMLNSKKNLYS